VENFDLYDVDESLNLNLPPLNESQQKAVEEAMKKPFTVIQGPPGIKILYNVCAVLFKNLPNDDCTSFTVFTLQTGALF